MNVFTLSCCSSNKLPFLPTNQARTMSHFLPGNMSSLHCWKEAALHINYRPWELAHTLEGYFHAPLSYFYCVTSFTSLDFLCVFSRTTIVFFLITFYTTLTLLDIDECSNGSHDCDVNANCTNTNGSHSCTCKEGYTGKGESCQGKIS